ncbi:unnamed protein product [Choristocarpus tenellus]
MWMWMLQGDEKNMHFETSLGHDRFEVAVAKELARVLGGAWHDDEDEPQEERGGEDAPKLTVSRPEDVSGFSQATTAKSVRRLEPGRKIDGGRPASGLPPGKKDTAALVARVTARLHPSASWQLPIGVDHYTDRAFLLRELVKDMPADQRLSFQTRVANTQTKEGIEGILRDFGSHLACLTLPHARSREMDLEQVKKDTSRERVVLNGHEVAFWSSPADHPHSWHEELWATIERQVVDSLCGVGSHGGEEAIAGRMTKGGDRHQNCNGEGGRNCVIRSPPADEEVRLALYVQVTCVLLTRPGGGGRGMSLTASEVRGAEIPQPNPPGLVAGELKLLCALFLFDVFFPQKFVHEHMDELFFILVQVLYRSSSCFFRLASAASSIASLVDGSTS